MAGKNKFYAVREGRIPGIYTNWPECQKQVSGYPNAAFKGFPTKEEAVAFMNAQISTAAAPEENPTGVHIYVDGSFSKGQYSWAFAVYEDGNLTHSDSGVGEDPEAAKMRNVAGELAGATMAIQWAEETGVQPISIHHDYSGLAKWATKEWQAKNPFTAWYAAFASQRLNWVTFCKVAGHTGVEGNELADRLAKQALGLLK